MGVSKVDFNNRTLMDLTDDTVTESDLLSGVTAHGANGDLITGNIVRRGAGSGTISTKAGSIALPAGYYDGSGSVSIASAEQANIIAENIKQDISILGVKGSLIVPSGTVNITENGTRNVSSYASANVNVPREYRYYNYQEITPSSDTTSWTFNYNFKPKMFYAYSSTAVDNSNTSSYIYMPTLFAYWSGDSDTPDIIVRTYVYKSGSNARYSLNHGSMSRSGNSVLLVSSSARYLKGGVTYQCQCWG